MTAAELAYRLRQLLSIICMRVRFRISGSSNYKVADYDQYSFCKSMQCLPSPTFDVGRLRQRAMALLNGEITVGAVSWRWNHSTEIWRRAPDTGHTWPNVFFGNIDYREGNAFGDIRLLWEPSRLQHLVDLAVLSQTLDERERAQALAVIQSQIESWFALNPPLTGPHYISSMECALRIISTCHALDLVRGHTITSSTWNALLRIVSSHAPLIESRLSLYSSTGNHTVAEAAGLVYAGLLFPEMPGATRWLKKGMALLTVTAETQVFPDGGGTEQAISYHEFNIHLLVLVTALLRYHSMHAPQQLSAAIDRGKRFLDTFRMADGRLPSIGDSDDGHALSEFFDLDECPTKTDSRVHTFEHAGYTIVKLSASNESKLIFDHGPLGMLPANAHGHSDALNLLLQVNGDEVLIDPGTFTYTGDPSWRQYFRSSAAHNAVTVDNKDQATQTGLFQWSKPFTAKLIARRSEPHDRGGLLASHDGYNDIDVRHFRGVSWKSENWVLVLDRLVGRGSHNLDLHWHFGRSPERIDGSRFEVPLLGGILQVRCLFGDVSTHLGQISPRSGWRSRAYGSLEPCTTVRVRFEGQLPHDFITIFRLPNGNENDAETRDAIEWMTTRTQ